MLPGPVWNVLKLALGGVESLGFPPPARAAVQPGQNRGQMGGAGQQGALKFIFPSRPRP